MIGNYWQTSRAPRYSLLFALPLLIMYQTLTLVVPAGPTGGVRNGADIMLQTLFVWIAGAWGPRIFMLLLIGVGAWLIARDIKTNRSLKPGLLGLMLIESLFLSLIFGIVVGGLTAALLGNPPAAMAIGLQQHLGRGTLLMLSDRKRTRLNSSHTDISRT